MDKTTLITRGAAHAFLVLGYVAAVSWFITNGERLFGKLNDFTGPLAMLLLLVLSVAVMGLLIFAKPAMHYLHGERQEGITLLVATIAWLALITGGVFSFILLR